MKSFGESVKGAMQTPQEAAAGLRMLAQSGLDTNQALMALPSVLKLATVGETDMKNAALSATAVMHTFGLEVQDIGHIGDVFSKAAASSATSVTEMMESMKQASSIANIYGVSLEETGAALATLANRGIEGSAAGTALRNMMKELAAPATEKAAFAMKQYGIQIFNADGSTKSLMTNLQQLADVTSRMSSQTKARFLEDLFNERGAKAANILLSDMEKMKDTLKDLQASSDGFGFMTEAQIKISQSTVGIIAEMKNSLALVFSEVFTEVSPQIKTILSEISALIKTDEFKQFFSDLAQAVVGATRWLIDHAEAIKNVALSYVAFKVAATTGAVALAGWGLAARTIGSIAAPLLAVSGAMGPVAAGATVAGTALAGLAGVLASPLVIGIAAAAAAWGLYTLSQRGANKQMDDMVEAAQGAVEATGRLAQSMGAALEQAKQENTVLEEQVRLMREGKAAANALSTAKANIAVREAHIAEDGAQFTLRLAEQDERKLLGDGPVDISKGLSTEQEKAVQRAAAARKVYAEAVANTAKVERTLFEAANESAYKQQLDTEQRELAQINAFNKKRLDAIELGAKAEARLKEKITGAAAAEERKRLQQEVELARKAEKLNPITSTGLDADSRAVALSQAKAGNAILTDLGYDRKAGGGHGGGDAKRAAKEALDTFVATKRKEIEAIKAAEKDKLDIIAHAEKQGTMTVDQASEARVQVIQESAASQMVSLGEIIGAQTRAGDTSAAVKGQQEWEAALNSAGAAARERTQDLDKYWSSQSAVALAAATNAATQSQAVKDEIANLTLSGAALTAYQASREAATQADLEAQAARLELKATEAWGSGRAQEALEMEVAAEAVRAYAAELKKLGKIKLADSIEKKQDAALDAMAASAGKLHKSLGAVGGAFAKLAKSQRDYGKDAEKSTRDQIGAYADLAGGMKEMFKEHSTGYNVMKDIETGFRIWEFGLALQNAAKEMGLITQVTTAKVEGNATAASSAVAGAGVEIAATQAVGLANAKTAVSNQGKGDPYTSWYRMAAMAAIMAGLGFAVRAGNSSSSDGAAAQAAREEANKKKIEATQASQGAGSVAGDRQAQSDSISQSLELLADVNTLTMKYSAQMVASLNSIDAALNGVKVNLSKTGVNDKTVTYENGAFGKYSYTLADSGVTFGGRYQTITPGAAGQEFLGQTFTNYKAPTVGELASGALAPRRYTDTLMNGGAITSNLDASTQEAFRTLFGSLAPALASAGAVFGRDAGTVMSSVLSSEVKIGREAVATADIFTSGAAGSISLIGMTDEEANAAIEAVISKAFDDIAKTVLPGFEVFQRIGEGYFETTNRVATGYDAAGAALQNLGIELIGFADVADKKSADIGQEFVRSSILASEGLGGVETGIAGIIEVATGGADALAQLYLNLDNLRTTVKSWGFDGNVISTESVRGAGGDSQLAAGISAYEENFLTPAQQLASQTARMAHEFERLGFTMPTTSEGFVAMVKSLDKTTDAGEFTFGQLMTLAGGFGDLMTVTKDLADANKELLDASRARKADLLDRYSEKEALSGAVDTFAAEGVTINLDDFFSASTADLKKVASDFIVTLDPATESGDKMLQVLEKVAPAFDTILEAVGKFTELQRSLVDKYSTMSADQAVQKMKSKGVDLDLAGLLGMTPNALRQIAATAIDGIDPATQSGRDLLLVLEELAPAFDVILAKVEERASLQTELLQVQGDTNALRQQELSALEPANRALKEQIYALQDLKAAAAATKQVLSDLASSLTSANSKVQSSTNAVTAVQDEATNAYVTNLNKVGDLQKRISDIQVESQNEVARAANEAAQRMAELGKELREYIAGANLTGSQNFSRLLTKAMAGDADAMAALPDAAKTASDEVELTAVTRLDAVREQKRILAEVAKVAALAESKATQVPVPGETATDKLVEAQAELVKAQLDLAASLQVANQINAPLTKSVTDLVGKFNTAQADLINATASAAALNDAIQTIKTLTGQIDTNTNMSASTLLAVSFGISNTLAGKFDLLDTSIDGLLSFDEFKTGFTGLASEQTLKELFNLADVNGDGQLSQLEALNAKTAAVDSALRVTLASKFDTLDSSLDGILTFTEFKTAFAGLATDQALYTLFTGLDANDDAQLTKLEVISNKNFSPTVIVDAPIVNVGPTFDANDPIRSVFNAIKNSIAIQTIIASGAEVNYAENTGALTKVRDATIDGQRLQGGMIHLALETRDYTWASKNYLANVSDHTAWTREYLRVLVERTTPSTATTTSSTLNVNPTQVDIDSRNHLGNMATYLYNLQWYFQQQYYGHPTRITFDRGTSTGGSGGPVFASGGAFTNGVVSRPTSFNMGLMGEAGPEAIMPLANIGGKLGVQSAKDPAVQKLLSKLIEEVQNLRAEAKATARHTAKTAQSLDSVITGGETMKTEAAL